MELTLQQLHLDEADRSIPDYGKGPDPYQAIQVHDYLSVSFFRQPAEIKASSRKIIELFSAYYPETVSYKYFVNVPIVMQWMMGKRLPAPLTLNGFTDRMPADGI